LAVFLRLATSSYAEPSRPDLAGSECRRKSKPLVRQSATPANITARALNRNGGTRNQGQMPQFVWRKGRIMIISSTAIYIAATLTLLIAGFIAVAVED
jgi:hypothetical protein